MFECFVITKKYGNPCSDISFSFAGKIPDAIWEIDLNPGKCQIPSDKSKKVETIQNVYDKFNLSPVLRIPHADQEYRLYLASKVELKLKLLEHTQWNIRLAAQYRPRSLYILNHTKEKYLYGIYHP